MQKLWHNNVPDLPFEILSRYGWERKRNLFFEEKEPETIEWIKSFSTESSFWDVGANIGMFSLFAGSMGHHVKSFEPEGTNFMRLRKNVGVNKFSISTYGHAVSDFDGKSTFYVPKSGPGRSGGQVGAAVDESGREFKPAESYEVETYKIDTLAGSLGVPNHIKIDVDGHEWRILQGAAVTLGNPELKSVLVEVNNCYADIDGYMKSFGFSDFNRFNGPDINRRANQKSRNVIYLR